MEFRFNIHKLIFAITSTIDLVGVTDTNHGKRVGYIISRLHDKLASFPWSKEECIVAGMLHDCGVSSTEVHEHLISELEWSGAENHCLKGEELLINQPHFMQYSKAIRYHHTRWSNIKPSQSDEFNSFLLGNLLFLSDRIDVMIATSTEEILTCKDAIFKHLSLYSNKLFNPDFIEAFRSCAEDETFWTEWKLTMNESYWDSWISSGEVHQFTFDELITIFKLLSSCVDNKESYQHNHSVIVSSLAKSIANKLQMSDDDIKRLTLAALIHDIGKLKVPDRIIEKASPLGLKEYEVIQHFSTDVYKILGKVSGLEEISLWGSQHVNIDPKSELPLPSKIISVVDTFEILSRHNPYHQNLSKDDILRTMNTMVLKGQLDPEIVEVVHNNVDLLYKIAQSK